MALPVSSSTHTEAVPGEDRLGGDDIASWRAAGLLRGDGGAAAEDRLALLRWLAEQGVTIEEMVSADADGRLFALIGDRIVRGVGERLPLARCAEIAGLDPPGFLALWRALGFPEPQDDAPLLTDAEASTFTVVAAAIDLVGEARGRRLGATISQAMRTIAEAVNVAFIDTDSGIMLDRSGSELATAQMDALFDSMIPDFHRWLSVLHALHHDASNRHLEMAYELGEGQTVRLAVGFADVTDYTSLSRRLSRLELADLIAEFGEWAADAVRRSDAQLVKTMGDGVLFVGSTNAVVSAALDLVHLGGAPRDLGLHAGVAYGEVLPSGGDYFGPTVNLAARLCGAASDGQVLLDEAAANVWAKRGIVEALGAHTLKGIEEPTAIWSAARRATPS